jgi:hypothetical protein
LTREEVEVRRIHFIFSHHVVVVVDLMRKKLNLFIVFVRLVVFGSSSSSARSFVHRSTITTNIRKKRISTKNGTKNRRIRRRV